MRRGLVALAVAVAVLGTWLAVDGHLGDPATTDAAASVPSRPADAFALIVVHVFDGDTIEARTSQPNDVLPSVAPVRIRLIGVDTPEGTPAPECWADQARDRLRGMLPEGSTVWASPDLEWRDGYDRTLLYLWTDDGRFVNYEAVAAGDADAMLVEPNGAHHELFVDAEAAARAAGAGKWGACP